MSDINKRIVFLVVLERCEVGEGVGSHSITDQKFTHGLKPFERGFFFSPSYDVPLKKVLSLRTCGPHAGPWEPSGPSLCSVGAPCPAAGAPGATPCCCWSRACSVCCRCCEPRCCSRRRAETSGPAACQLFHLHEQERSEEEEGGATGGRKQ